MGTGILSQHRDFPRNGFPLLGTAACLISVFMLDWLAHAHLMDPVANDSLYKPKGSKTVLTDGNESSSQTRHAFICNFAADRLFLAFVLSISAVSL